MTDHEQPDFELQLRRTRPAQPPAAFVASLLSRLSEAKVPPEVPLTASPIPDCLRTLMRSLRWLFRATAVGLLALVVWRSHLSSATGPANAPSSPQNRGATSPALAVDDIKIDQQLVSSFDAVARLPGGEPVRFRCENWIDQVVLSDKSRGVIAENWQPRFEVVALGIETY